jgi:hypothetical protein
MEREYELLLKFCFRGGWGLLCIGFLTNIPTRLHRQTVLGMCLTGLAYFRFAYFRFAYFRFAYFRFAYFRFAYFRFAYHLCGDTHLWNRRVDADG